jgi:hypothetical protein
MRWKKNIIFLIIVIVFLVGFYILKPQSSGKLNLGQTDSVFSNVQKVLGTATGKCHAVQVDPNDSQAVLPDKNCTPGSINHDVAQNNIDSTICRSGFTAEIRPKVSYTNKLKAEQITEYGYEDTSPKDYEEDHLISLELGGDPSDPKNLWPEPHASFNEKDKLENYLHKEVCNGKISLQVAQNQIRTNWFKSYQELVVE